MVSAKYMRALGLGLHGLGVIHIEDGHARDRRRTLARGGCWSRRSPCTRRRLPAKTASARRISCSASSTLAPTSVYVRAGSRAPAPALRSTKTSISLTLSRCTLAGVTATRVSPGAVSLRAPTVTVISPGIPTLLVLRLARRRFRVGKARLFRYLRRCTCSTLGRSRLNRKGRSAPPGRAKVPLHRDGWPRSGALVG